MTDFTKQVCGTSPTLTKYDCKGQTIIEQEDPVTPTTPPVVTDPTDVDEGIDPPTSPATSTPHNPPVQVTPATVDFFVMGELNDSPNQFGVAVCDPDDPGQMASSSLDYNNITWTAGATDLKVGNLMVSEDKLNCWHLNHQSASGVYNMYLVHWDMTDPTAPVKSYEYNIYTELGGSGSGAARVECFSTTFYSDITKRIYIAYHLLDQGLNGLAIYDVSSPTSNPTLISKTNLAGWGTSQRLFGLEVDYDESHVYVGGNNGTPNPIVHSASVSVDGVTVAYTGTVVLSGATPNSVRLRRLNKNILLVTVAVGSNQNLYSIDISDPTNMSVRDSLGIGAAIHASAVPGSIAISTDNTRAYIHISTNGSGACVAVVDVSDVDAMVLLSSNYNLDSVTIDDFYGDRLHYVESDRSLAPYLIALTGGANIVSIDVSNDTALATIDQGPSPEDAESIGCARGPKTFRAGSESGSLALPVPVDANLAVVTGSVIPYGVAIICGLDDYTAPTADVVVRETDLFNSSLGPYAAFTYDGHLALLGSGALRIYTNGASFALAGTLSSASLVGAKGLVASKIQGILWTMVENTLIEIDVSDPSAPVISSSADIGPSYYDDDAGDAEVYGLTDNEIIIEQDGPDLVDQTSGLRTGWTRPIELINAKAVCIDGTYAYVWNDYNGGGLAVFAYTADTFSFVGYYHNGTRTLGGDEPRDILKVGDYIYILHYRDTSSNPGLTIVDVSDPTAPVLAAEYVVGSDPAALAYVSATEILIIARKLTRLDITTPETPTAITTLNTGRSLLSGAIANGKLVAFDSNKNAVSYSLSSPIVQEDVLALATTGDVKAYGMSIGGQDFVVVAHSQPSTSIPAFMVVNVTTVGAITLAGSRTTTGLIDGFGFDSTTRQGFVGSFGLDLANPSNPKIVNRIYNPNQEFDRNLAYIAMSGTTAVVARSNDVGGLVVVDVSDLTNPTTSRSLGDRSVSKRVSPGKLYSIRGENNAICVGFSPFRITAGLVTDGEPRVGAFTEPGIPPSIVFGGAALSDDGDYFFIAYRGSALPNTDWAVRCYDVSTSSTAVLTGEYYTQREISGVKVSGTSMVVMFTYKSVTSTPMLAIVDFTDPYDPVLLGEVEAYETSLTNFSVEIY